MAEYAKMVRLSVSASIQLFEGSNLLEEYPPGVMHAVSEGTKRVMETRIMGGDKVKLGVSCFDKIHAVTVVTSQYVVFQLKNHSDADVGLPWYGLMWVFAGDGEVPIWRHTNDYDLLVDASGIDGSIEVNTQVTIIGELVNV